MNNIIDLEEEIHRAAQIVEQGGVVAFPTDTFYGLGCDPFNEKAVDRIFEIKMRPSGKAILLLISDLHALKLIVPKLPEGSEVLERFNLLKKSFWPGPLTIVLPALSNLPSNLVSQDRTIGVRFPDYAPTIKFTRAVGGVITATSANLSGRSNAQTAQEVIEQLGNGADYVLDAGPCPGGLPSSVIDIANSPPELVREGAISREVLVSVIGIIK